MSASLPSGERPTSILDLARRDPAAAAAALAKLPIEAQVAAVCDAPPARRSELLGLVPAPEDVIPLMPEAELCFTVKAIGLADAAWLLEYATPEQVTAAIDLDGWDGLDPDLPVLGEWFDALAGVPEEAMLRAVTALDSELLAIFLAHRIEVFLKPNDDDGWQPPEGGMTLDGQFYYRPYADDDDVASITTTLQRLFQHEYWTYFRMLQAVVWELPSDLHEWALRWRSGRLQDLGFPPWDESMRIYRFLHPSGRSAIPPGEQPLAVGGWPLPIWISGLPESASPHHRIFRAIAGLDEEERRACFYAFLAVANKVAVADRMPLSDSESTPRAIEKTARFASAGLALIAQEHALDDPDVLRRVPIERLFTVGANLDPEGARP